MNTLPWLLATIIVGLVGARLGRDQAIDQIVRALETAGNKKLAEVIATIK